jgi:hypothetical protein
MKKILSISALVVISALGQAQFATNSNPPSIPQTSQSIPNQTNASQLSFTNRSGQVFSAEQLTTQLQQLRTVVDQTLPVLSAFNEEFATNAAADNASLPNRIGSILSGIMTRTNSTSGQSSTGLTNAIAILNGLLNTNAPGSVTMNPNTLNQLVTLQNNLQPIPGILQALNVGGAPSTPKPSDVISSRSADRTNQGVTPTGR